MRFHFILFVVLMFLVPVMATPESSKTVEIVELDHPVLDAKDKMQGSNGVDVVKLIKQMLNSRRDVLMMPF